MLLVNRIREHKNEIAEQLKVRNIDVLDSLDRIIIIDDDRKKKQTSLEDNNAESNSIARKISELFKTGNKDAATELKENSAQLKSCSKQLQEEIESLEKELLELLYSIPNVPNKLVPTGNSDQENEIIFESENNVRLADDALPHWELTDKYDIIDFELGVKITGAGFPVYKGQGAKLQRALINFFLDEAEKAGYLEVQPPILINEASGYGTGQLPDKEGQMYHAGVDNLFLIPTAEVPVTNMYRNVILKKDQLPLKNTAYTPCFRREAGSYGKDVRGLNRLHQFDKVEIVRVEYPDNSYQALEEMVEYVKSLLEKLELPYRVTRLCGGDLGFTSALTYDMEVYSAGQDKWLEVSSVSNFESFQANRLKLRYKEGDAKPELAHTLNGSALAFPRIVASLLENNQTENGIKIPKALVPYTRFEMIE
ncbi:MAG: serine--tRNA ligase [Flavobacteriales bacterium]|nr:serine--tRNA ligase [Flavobacteriales bacterium]